jgi:Ca-activated chloride channel family protein
MCQFIKLVNFSKNLLLIQNRLFLMLLISANLFANELATERPMSGLLYQDAKGRSNSAPLLSTKVLMNVNGLINRVSVKQVFVNDSEDWITASYLFPLPENAAVDHLNMQIGERVVVGEIQEKEQARNNFEQARLEGKKSSLIEFQRNNIFTNKVANIAPGEQIIIEIAYQHSVAYKSGVFSLYFPMTITPRYAQHLSTLSTLTSMQDQQDQQALTHNSFRENNNQQSLSQREPWVSTDENHRLAQQTIKTIKSPADADLLLELIINLNSTLPIEQVNSPYHPIDIHTEKTQKNEQKSMHISLSDGAVIADRDFVLNWQVQQTDNTQTELFIQQAQDQQQYGLLMFVPPAETFLSSSRINKEVIFVLDISGSMAGTSIRQAKKALIYAVEQLGNNDSFNIITFNDKSEFFAGNSLTVDKRSKAMANSFIQQLKASGGTNMQVALADAFNGQRTVYPDAVKGLRQIIFITDASISNEEQLLTQIEQQLGDSRLFMVGIGSAPNHYLMKNSAKLGRGTYTKIADVNEVEKNMSFLFKQLANPVLTDINLQWIDGSKIEYWPQSVSDLYMGEPLQVAFKIPEGKQGLIIDATRLDKTDLTSWQQTINLEQRLSDKEIKDVQNQGIDLLWAKYKIDSIDLHRYMSNVDKKKQITELGLRHHIVTKYTSLIAVEQEVSRPGSINSLDKKIKTHMPYGNQMSLPQTGLGSELYKKIGLLLLFIAAFLWIAERHICTKSTTRESGI